jgi:hypothetical protein
MNVAEQVRMKNECWRKNELELTLNVTEQVDLVAERVNRRIGYSEEEKLEKRGWIAESVTQNRGITESVTQNRRIGYAERVSELRSMEKFVRCMRGFQSIGFQSKWKFREKGEGNFGVRWQKRESENYWDNLLYFLNFNYKIFF